MSRFKRGETIYLNSGSITAYYLTEFQSLDGKWYVVAQQTNGAMYIRDRNSFPSEKKVAIDYKSGEH